jgi:dihydroxy-acid dehydratase
MIAIDLPARTLDAEITPNELQRRREAWTAPAPKYTRGWLARYTALVSNASTGAVLEVPGVAAAPSPTPTGTPFEVAR